MPAGWQTTAAALADLGTLDPAWRGWKLERGLLVSPDGWTFRPGDVSASALHAQELAALRAERRQPQQLLL